MSLHQLDFDIGGATRSAGIDNLIIAGWTGRDRAEVEQHIAELAAIGVNPPTTVPCFYRVGANLLTNTRTIDVAGSHSSGEVEFVLVSLAAGLHVGVGSDHTDRKVEAYGVTVSKQMCPKPIGRELWKFSDVEAHWDELMLRSWLKSLGHCGQAVTAGLQIREDEAAVIVAMTVDDEPGARILQHEIRAGGRPRPTGLSACH